MFKQLRDFEIIWRDSKIIQKDRFWDCEDFKGLQSNSE